MSFTGLCCLCRVGYFLVLSGLAVMTPPVLAYAQAGTVPVQDAGQFWAQILTGGVILALGAWAILAFLKYKDEATKQSHALEQQLGKLNHALMGIEGYGGLLEGAKLDQARRHDLGNQLIRMNERMHDLSVLVGRLCAEAGIPFDDTLLEDS